MTNARALEMFIKPNFKYFLLPFGSTCIHSGYTFNTIREAKVCAEKQWLENGKRYDILNVYYCDRESDFGGGWRSKKILWLDENDCSWHRYLDTYDLHTAFFFSYDDHTISEWNIITWRKLRELEIERFSEFEDLTEEEIRVLLKNKK